MTSIPPFLEGLPAPLYAEIQALSKTYTLKPRQALFQEGDSADSLFVLKKGCLMLSKVNSKGAELCLNLIYEGELFGIASLLPNVFFSGRVVAMQASQVQAIPALNMMEIVEREPLVAREVIYTLVRRLQMTQNRLREAATESAEYRLASTLLEMSAKVGIPSADGILINLRLSQNHLAEMNGLRPETVSRIFGRWQQAGWVKCKRYKVVICDISALQNVISGAGA